MEIIEFTIFILLQLFLFIISISKRAYLFNLIGIVSTLLILPLAYDLVLYRNSTIVYANPTLTYLILSIIIIIHSIVAIRGIKG